MNVPRLLVLFAIPLLSGAATPEYAVRVIHVYPHDPGSFTQGLEYHDGLLYEGTGLNGRSKVRVERLETGQVIREIHVPAAYFGEGITLLHGRLLELTWKAQTGFIYDEHLQMTGRFPYSGEGWGLANDGKQIYMSDGTAEIRVWEADTLHELRRIKVHDGEKLIDNLNELECVHGEIYANVWMTDRIARISPVEGRVLGWIDAAGLLTEEDRAANVDVLNGIAYDATHNRLFITGKLWPKLFEIELRKKVSGATSPVSKYP